MPSESVYSDGLNRIRELPEEYEKQPRNDRALTQKDSKEDHRFIPYEASREDSGELTDHRFDDEISKSAADKST